MATSSKRKGCPLGVVACSAAAASETASVDEIAGVGKGKETKASVSKFRVSSGCPMPLGAVSREDGVNLAVFSNGATAATLCLFTPSDLQQNRVTEEIPFDHLVNRTGDIWHIFLHRDDLKPEDMLYGYRFDGPYSPQDGHYFDASLVVLDPYAKAVLSRGDYGVTGLGGDCWPQMAGMLPCLQNEFDWEGDLPLQFPKRDLIIYELHIRGFTRHESSKTNFPGTYLGVVEKLDHIKDLGINCIELMPCHEFNELEYFDHNSTLGNNRLNFWGYSTINYFSPMLRYSSAGMQNCGHDAINEVKLMIKEAHKRGIEVILDVVYNHTAEGNEKGPTLSFRGIDNRVYYTLGPKGEFYNYSGCGNTFNCNHPIVRQFIVDSLRYWVTEMHIDGFRFDLAAIMTRASSMWDAANTYGNPSEHGMLPVGTPLADSPLIDLITNDPVLSGVKLIAEAWDAAGLYQVGKFPHQGVWSEWNGQYRDIVRQFIKGTDGFSGAFAQSLCGSPNLYQEGGRKPWNSINFVCVHDGFTLADLVTYNKKHNLSNGENNNDGENHNNSWNCGEEGEFASIHVRKLRKKQMRNFFLCLMVSQGVPMIQMGDEYGHTKVGNNNSYCHDTHINYFRWDKMEESSSSDFFRFCRLMNKFRSECECLGLDDFPTSERLQWHGHIPEKPDWSDNSRFVAFSMKDSVNGAIYVAFNASHLPVTISLPELQGYRWEPLVDTSKPAPYDFLADDLPDKLSAIQQYTSLLDANIYPMLSYSSIILLLRPNA